MFRTTVATLGALLLSAPALAMPLTEWGATAQASTAVCPSFCTSFQFAPGSGGQGQATAPTTGISDSRGSAQARAALDPALGISTPILANEAFSDGGFPGGQGSAFGTSFGVEGYTNTSGASQSYTLDITLDATVSDGSGGDGSASAEVIAWLPENFFFSSSRATLEFEAGATVIDGVQLEIEDNVLTSIGGSISFTLGAGDSVYVWAFLRTEARGGGSFADAFSTLTTEFVDDTGLVAASVPEPTALALLAGVFLGFARGRRR